MSPQKKDTPAPSSDFVGRVSSLPVVSDTVSKAKTFTAGKFIVDTATTTATTVKHYTTPIHSRFSKQITQADKLAVKSLDYVEGRFPIVAKPTGEIIGDIQAVFNPVFNPAFTAVKKVHAKLDQNVAEPARYILQKVRETSGAVRVFISERYNEAVAEAKKPDVSVVQKATNIVSVTAEHTRPVVEKTLADAKNVVYSSVGTVKERVSRVIGITSA